MTFEQGELIVYQSEDGQPTVDVRLKDETVWLSRKEMAILFNRDYKTGSKHINNVFNGTAQRFCQIFNIAAMADNH